MKTFIFRIIAIFSVLLVAQNAFAYGAIVHFRGSSSDQLSIITNQASKTEAENMAMASCQNFITIFGGGDCSAVLATFVNQFYTARVVGLGNVGDVGFGFSGNSQAEADSAFLTDCNMKQISPCGLNSVSRGQDTTTCPAGQFAGADTCEACASGLISAVGTDDSCTACPNNLIANTDQSACICPAGMSLIPGQTDMCETTPPTCTGDLELNTGRDMCICPAGMQLIPGETTMCENSPPVCTGDLELNAGRDMCICPAGMRLISGQTDMCETPATPPMNDSDCDMLTAGDLFVDSRCQTPQSCGGATPFQADDRIACRAARNNAECNMLNPGDTFVNNMCETPATPPVTPPVNPPTPPTTTTPSDNNTAEKTANVIAGIYGVAVIGIMYNAGLIGGGVFGLTPDYAFAHNNGVMIHSYGGRLDYENDNFSAYYAAQKTAASGFVYSSGMAYSKDFWHADYNAKSEGDNTAANISAGFKWQSGIITASSAVAADWQIGKESEDFSAFVRNAAELKYNNWQIIPSVNLYWRQNGGGESMRMRLDLRREF